jgi:hypothetical protein
VGVRDKAADCMVVVQHSIKTDVTQAQNTDSRCLTQSTCIRPQTSTHGVLPAAGPAAAIPAYIGAQCTYETRLY